MSIYEEYLLFEAKHKSIWNRTRKKREKAHHGASRSIVETVAYEYVLFLAETMKKMLFPAKNNSNKKQIIKRYIT